MLPPLTKTLTLTLTMESEPQNPTAFKRLILAISTNPNLFTGYLIWLLITLFTLGLEWIEQKWNEKVGFCHTTF